MWDDYGATEKAMAAANGALEEVALIGSASAVLAEVIDAESSMTALMRDLGAGLQGFSPGIAPAGSIGAGQTSVDVSGLWDADTAHQEACVHIGETATRCDSQSIVRPPAAGSAYNRIPNELAPFLPESVSLAKVEWGALPAVATVPSGPRNDSPTVSIPRAVANSPIAPAKLIWAASGEESQPTDASLEKPTLLISDITSTAPSLISLLSRNLNVTRTEPGAEVRPVRSDAIELAQQSVSSISAVIEAASPTPGAPLHKDTLAIRAWQESRGKKIAWPDGRLDGPQQEPISGPSSEPKNGVVVVDGGYLGRWIFDCLSRQASRPCGGTTGIDPRVSATYPGAAVGV